MYWNTVTSKYEQALSNFIGENRQGTVFDIDESESRESRNTSCKNYPALSPRNSRTEECTISTFNALGERNNEYIHVQDGTTWKYWNGTAWVNIQTGLTSAKGIFRDFATGTTRYTILMNGTDKYAWDGSTVTNLTNAPASNKFTTHDGKIYIARDNDIVFSATNLINDYSSADDAGTIDVTDAKGQLTGITSFDGYVIAFTEYSKHKLYGTSVADFELKDEQGGIGCISNNSIVTANGVLYWAAYDGIYASSGGETYKISKKVDGYYDTLNTTYRTKICAGAINRKIYFSIPTGTSTSNNLLLIYDTQHQKWFVETGSFDSFTTIGNVLYGVDPTGSIKNMDDSDGSETVTWYWTSGVRIKDQPSKKKTLSSVWVTVDLPTGSTLTLATSSSIDGDDFVTQKTFTAGSDMQEVKINVNIANVQNSNWYRLKLSGTGDCTVHFIEENYRVR